MTNELENVYTGSIVEAQFLVEMLHEQKIGSILRDSLGESIVAGWGQGMPEGSAQIFVETENAEMAKKIIQEYFDNR